MTATLQLVREGTILELRRGTFFLLLDDEDVASIESRQRIEVPLEVGHHTLQVRACRYTSRQRDVDAGDGEIVNFRCYGGWIWPIYLASIVSSRSADRRAPATASDG